MDTMKTGFISQCLRVFATSRPPFLLLPPCCLAIAVAYAVAEGGVIDWGTIVLMLIGALFAHVSVNMFNEYEDFSSGLDFFTRRTAFSGGSGTLPAWPQLATSVRIGAFCCLSITILIGIFFLWLRGVALLAVGIPGLLLVYFYSSHLVRSPLACLLAPGLGFGPVMITGGYFVLSGHYSVAVVIISMIVFFLASNLLLLNQFPDVEADRRVGRRHLPLVIGRFKSALIFAGFYIATYTWLLLCVQFNLLPSRSLLGLLSLLFAFPAVYLSLRYADDIPKLMPALALNVAAVLSTPVLIAVGLLWQSH